MVCLATVTFEEGKGHIVDGIAPDILNASEKAQLAYLAIPDSLSFASKSVDTIHTFRLRYTSPIPLGSCPLSNHRFIFGVSLFRQQADPLAHRGASQKSFVVLSNTPFLHLWTKVCTILGYCPTVDSSMLTKALSEISSWPSYVSNPTNLDFFGNTLTLGETGFRDIHLTEVFGEIFPALWHLWEALLIGLPILVVCPGDASRVSRAVLSCLSLLSPWQYQGDYRPYLPVFDKDYQTFATNPSACIVGVTSALAIEQLSHSFPIVLVLDSEKVSMPAKTRVVSGGACSLFINPDVASKSGGTRSIWSLGSSSQLRLYCGRDEQACKTGNEHVIREVFRLNTEAVLNAFSACRSFTEEDCIRDMKVPEKLGSVIIARRKFENFLQNVSRGPNLRVWLQQRLNRNQN